MLNTSNLKEAITIIELVQKDQKCLELQDLCTRAINLINKTASSIKTVNVEDNSHCMDFDYYGKQNREYWKDKEPLCKQ